MEWWSDFLYLLTNDDHFRSGFIWGLLFVAIGWAIWAAFQWLYVQWLKMRQFFEPTKKPGRTPVETGPSPASIMLGCLWRILATLVFVAIAIALLIWALNSFL